MDGIRTRTGRELNFLANGVSFGMPNDGWAWRAGGFFPEWLCWHWRLALATGPDRAKCLPGLRQPQWVLL
jgi:hypothetical protein